MTLENFTEDLGNGVKLEMTFIPGGSFLMGSEDFDDTKPVHSATLSPFYIGKFQVTQQQWQAVMGNNPSHFKGDSLPVESVSWEKAVEFCEKLSEQTGKTYRLPTEAEWEYACRAGSTGKYCFGDDEALLKDYAWYDKNSDSKTHPVGEKLPNKWGLHDMHGNVWEWCSDWYNANYYAELSEVVNPQGPPSGKYRALRGGSWFSSQSSARAVCRYDDSPGVRYYVIGFRVVVFRPPSALAADGALAPETKPEIPAAMLVAATAAVADHACHVKWDDAEEARMFRNQAEAALKAAGVLELLAERAKLKDALKWAMIEIGEGYCTEEDETPTHACEFTSNPEKGGCDYHEAFWDAMELLREKI